MTGSKCCIVSFFMDNVALSTVECQRAVVEKFNPSRHPHYQIKTALTHEQSIDRFWAENGVPVGSVSTDVHRRRTDHDVVLFLDIDCIPLCMGAIDRYLEAAARGVLIGNIQRSNHIENNEHLFVAPSALAISRDVFRRLGAPSAQSTKRGDVAEEYTYRAEACGVRVEAFLPRRFDAAPGFSKTDVRPVSHWPLKAGLPHYGVGTTYGSVADGDLFYHCFQIFWEGNQARFCEKARSVLSDSPGRAVGPPRYP